MTTSIIPFRTEPAGRRGHELAFLPAALEIIESPPSPVGRAIGVTLIALFAIALGWACVGSIDVIATATGKVVPSGRSKVIQPFEIGVVRAIHVQDGQTVKAGDVLIELDPTINDAERDHAKGDLISAKLEVARLRAALSDASDPTGNFHPPEGASDVQVETETQFLVSQTAEHRAKLDTLDRQLTEKEAERDTAKAQIDKIGALVPILQQQVDIRQTLLEHQIESKLVYLQNLQTLVEQQQELLVQKNRYREAEAAVSAISASRAQTDGEYRRTLYDDLVKAEAKVAGYAQDLIKSGARARLEQLTAPIDGVVQQLAVHTVGGVVTPAQALLVIVPTDSHLEIQALVPNRDIGFVHAGQRADIKVNTFPYTRYGLLHGDVESVSADAVTSDQRSDKSDQHGDAASKDTDDASTKEPVYEARVSLDRAQMQIDDNIVNLAPGMAVTIEIKTGSRRVVSYLLSPLLRYGHESLRER